MDAIFKYGKIEGGKFKNPFLNEEICQFLKLNEGKIISYQFNVVGEKLIENRKLAYFHCYLVPSFVKLLNDEKTRFPTITIETKATAADFLKRYFIGVDDYGNALSLKTVANERFLPDLVNPVIAFAKLIYNVDLEPPTKQFKIKRKKIIKL